MGCTHCLIVLPLGCPVLVGGLLQGLPLTMYFTEELLPRFNVASFCLELLQDVHNTKHRDAVLLVSMYRLSILVTLASNSAICRSLVSHQCPHHFFSLTIIVYCACAVSLRVRMCCSKSKYSSYTLCCSRTLLCWTWWTVIWE